MSLPRRRPKVLYAGDCTLVRGGTGDSRWGLGMLVLPLSRVGLVSLTANTGLIRACFSFLSWVLCPYYSS